MKRVAISLCMLLLFAAPVRAQQSAPPAFANDAPVEVTSERLEAKSSPRVVTFSGDVVARQDDLVIYADRLQVLFTGGGEEIETLEATGNVRIVQGASIATGRKGVYERARGIVTLSGEPRVRQGEDFVEGDEVIVYLNEGRSVVVGTGDSRVKAVIHPQEGTR